MIVNLDLEELRTFVAIVDSQSFSRAADLLGRSQSAVSLRLRRLEQVVGVELLRRRQGRIIELTDDGRHLLGYARQMISLNDHALRDLSPVSAVRPVRLGIPADFLNSRFSVILDDVRMRMDGVSLEIKTDVSDQLRERCLDGDLDVAVYKSHGPDGHGKILMSLPMVWVTAATAHPSPMLPSVASANGRLSLVCFPDGCAYRRAMVAALTEAGLSHHIAVTTPSLEGLCQAVAGGHGLSALPRDLLGGSVTVGAVEDGLPSLGVVNLSMVTSGRGGAASSRVARFLEDGVGRFVC